jgi:hypothetical protein
MREQFTTSWRVGTGGATSSWMTRTGGGLLRPWKRWWSLLHLLDREEQGRTDKRRSNITGEQRRDHGVAEAERIMNLAQEELGIEDWSELKKGDWRKGLVAVLIRKHALVDNGWLSGRLAMGARTAVSRTRGSAREYVQADRKAKAIARRLEGLISQR